MIIDDLQLISGTSIQIESIGLKIKQPKIRDIAQIGEAVFYNYLSYFRITKENILNGISDRDQVDALSQLTEYEILHLLISSDPEIEVGMCTILNLIIEDIEFAKFNKMFLIIKLKSGQQHIINNESFLIIKDIIYQIFDIKIQEAAFNPANKQASDIAKKLEERKRKLAELQGKKDESMLADLISILAVGLGCVNIDEILDLTLYQILILIKRFGMYSQYNVQIQAMLQGAEDIELVDWMKKI
jgi:hypothetical protein